MTGLKPNLFVVDGSIAVTGALVAAAQQAQVLKDKVDTILVLPRGHRVPAARTAAFAEVIELPIVNMRKSAAGVFLYLPALLVASVQLRWAMRRRGCERLQLNDFYLLHGAMLRLLGYRGRIVTFIRIDPTRFGIPGRFWLAAARWSSTELVAVSRFIQRLLGAKFPSRLVYAHISPDPRTIKKPASTARILLFVGNFIEGKGQDCALAAFNQIASHFPDARLRLVGGDMGLAKNREYRRGLEKLSNQGSVANQIEFYGASDDLAASYAEAFAALNFSVSESFSMTCLDGSAAGLPVIATRCGGPEEIIDDGATGFLVPVGDVAAMAERMTWLLKYPEEAAAMGGAGRRLVSERFSPARSKVAFRSLFDL